MYRIIVLDNLAQEGLDLLKAADDIQYEVRPGLAGAALREALADFDGAICRSGVKLTADVLEGNCRLKAIARAGVGTDNIDKHAATRAGIVVMNTPGGNTISTAEHTMAMMLALSRNIAPAYQSLIEGRWDRKKFMGCQLAGKTLGIVGLGRIGQVVALRAQAFEMHVLGFDPFTSADRARELGIEYVETLDEMLPRVDYLTVHTPLTDETRGLIGPKQIESLRPGVRLVNCARGGIFDEAALVDGLKSGKIAGVALDVYSGEPCTDNPLFGMPGVVATPHLGASTEEAQTQVATEAVALMLDYLKTGTIRHGVNIGPLDAKTLESLRGFLDIAYRLGLLMAGLHEGGIRQCRLTYRGEIAEKETSILSSVFAAGLLQGALDAEVNLVNAMALLDERGIELIEERRRDMGAFRSAITAEVITDQGSRRATGTLFGHNMPRLAEIDQYRIEAFLDGTLLVFRHQDVPGIIGIVGTIFGNHRVNIAQMAVGRAGDQPGGMAIGVLNLDSDPPAAALTEVLAQPDIASARVIHLPPPGVRPAWLLG
ncbi:MAG: phosphoglycerate dehydrogenase [Pirellulales bacterium]|nr:phosphoglycerate dehydrogenase [Pirellulales bacterium]